MGEQLETNKETDRIELFMDYSYYSMWCVRRKGVTEFNSQENFHFISLEDAKLFKELAEISK